MKPRTPTWAAAEAAIGPDIRRDIRAIWVTSARTRREDRSSSIIIDNLSRTFMT
jgi:hypothetical protein